MNKQEKLEQLKKEYELKKLIWAVEQAKVENSKYLKVFEAEYAMKLAEMEIEKAQEELKLAK